MKKFSIALLILVGIAGCAGTVTHEPSAVNALDNQTGVLIDCMTPVGAQDIVGHLVRVDQGEWIQVAPRSLKVVYLSPGVHQIEFVSAGSKSGSKYYPGYELLKDNYYTYGRPVEGSVKIPKGALRKVKYIAPFWNTDQGKIEIGGLSVVLPP